MECTLFLSLLHPVTQGDQEFVERSNRVAFGQHDKITLKMSWLFFVKTLESLCDAENFVFFGDILFIIPSF